MATGSKPARARRRERRQRRVLGAPLEYMVANMIFAKDDSMSSGY
jgi:hypothetical protein